MGALPSAKLRFPRSRRFQKGHEFARAKNEGQRFVSGCLIANWVPAQTPGFTKLGVITSSRIGPAVVRSRARRLLRESFRLNQHGIKSSHDLVLIARNSISQKKLQEVSRDFLRAMKHAKLLNEEVQ
ncbi:MAG: rnpA [Verrucomicrobiales bacterium]|nr:rnpA [Verrucomicrobiales bacterium]MDB6128962.1 rnpA [Verrucomicrobiales bacterium]